MAITEPSKVTRIHEKVIANPDCAPARQERDLETALILYQEGLKLASDHARRG